MLLPDLDRWAECWGDLQRAHRSALAFGASLDLVQNAEASGCIGQSWGSFSLIWAGDLRNAGAGVEQLLHDVHEASRLVASVFDPFSGESRWV